MRIKTINFAEGTIDNPLGYVGEHNATTLVITPSAELANNESIVTYSVAFGVNGKIYHSENVAKAETFTCLMWQEVTASHAVTIQVEGVDADGEILAKTETLLGKLCTSVEGTDETSEFTPPIIAEIAANTAARHTHANKAVLDGFAENALGELTYKGDGFATDADIANKQDKLTAGDNITITGNVISADIDNTREIATANNPYLSTYTPAELNTFYSNGLLLTYANKPITWANYESGTFHFGYAYTSRTSNSIVYRTDCVVAANKVITLNTDNITPRTVNSKTAGKVTGNIQLEAGDITAAAGWSPTNDTDLATKKYVDDNAGGTPDWSDIQNKPNFATVATSGDYDDLINKPVIPPSWVAQATAPLDTSLLWIDTSDNTVEDLADADNSEY